MKRNLILTIVVVAFCIAGVTHAVHAITMDEAKANADKAAEFIKANGMEKARAEICNPHGRFTKGDLYVYVMDFNGVHIANGGNPSLNGINHLELKDPNGVYLTKEAIEVAKTKGAGWINYSWVNPVTKKVQAKTTYVKRIEGADYYVACGVWK